MIEFKNIKYNKEYKELVRAFIPESENKGLNIILEEKDGNLFLDIDTNVEKIKINKNVFPNNEKSRIKHHLYKLLKNYTKRELSWGILVGVSPLNLIEKILINKPQAYKILEEDYLISRSKINLSKNILYNQSRIKNLKNGYSLYLDIPFCPSKCAYCTYPTYSSDNIYKISNYVDMLVKEIRELGQILIYSPQSIYIGGGTPSSIGLEFLKIIIKELKKNFPNNNEFTVEVGRVDTIDKNLLLGLKELGINRISINPQTMNQKTLDAINRPTPVHEIIDTYYLAREVGFENINMDIILGLPNENLEDIRHSLMEIKKLSPDSVSIHGLALKKGNMLDTNTLVENSVKELELMREEIFEGAGYHPYYLYRQKNLVYDIENIGYCKIGKHSVYNIVMMQNYQSIIGLGLGSSTKILKNGNIYRHMNYRELDRYIAEIDINIREKSQLIKEHLIESKSTI